jgi:hypothetical protein
MKWIHIIGFAMTLNNLLSFVEPVELHHAFLLPSSTLKWMEGSPIDLFTVGETFSLNTNSWLIIVTRVCFERIIFFLFHRFHMHHDTAQLNRRFLCRIYSQGNS